MWGLLKGAASHPLPSAVFLNVNCLWCIQTYGRTYWQTEQPIPPGYCLAAEHMKLGLCTADCTACFVVSTASVYTSIDCVKTDHAICSLISLTACHSAAFPSFFFFFTMWLERRLQMLALKLNVSRSHLLCDIILLLLKRAFRQDLTKPISSQCFYIFYTTRFVFKTATFKKVSLYVLGTCAVITWSLNHLHGLVSH